MLWPVCVCFELLLYLSLLITVIWEVVGIFKLTYYCNLGNSQVNKIFVCTLDL